MTQDLVRKIYESDGIFVGGFVRDWIIREEDFNDFDFYFESVPEWILSWDFCGKAYRNKINGKDFHCQKIPFNWDLSCNFFNFSKKRGLFAKPTISTFNYQDAFKMILKKQFAYLDSRAGNLRIKMLRKGWINNGINFGKNSIEMAPESGGWDLMQNVFLRRFNKFINTNE